MKKTFLLLLLITTISSAQSLENPNYPNFILENKTIKWQKVFDTNLSKNELGNLFIKNIVSNFQTENLQEFEDRILFNVKQDKIDFKSMGGSWGSTALFVQYPIDYFVMVDIKENKYRITIKNIIVDMSSAGFGNTANELINYITKKKNSVFRKSSASSKGATFFNNHFMNKFDINKISKENDEW